MTAPFLSLIIPAYNEERRLPHTLEEVAGFLERQAYTYEILIVENGSQDRTLEIARQFAAQHPAVCAIHESERGKGRAVRRGMLEAAGQFRFMCDADLSMPIDQLNRFLPPQQTDPQVVIASREAAGAVRYHEPLYRHLGGRAINLMIRLLALPGLHDTQCGFKCFRGDIAADLFGKQTLAGWSFDVELLYIARLRGYRIVELPIPWYYGEASKVNALQDAFKIAVDILAVRRNARQGLYAAG